MNRLVFSFALLVVLGLALSGCYAGPGHTRAAGAGIGTGTGAVVGAVVGGHYGDPVAGAVVGGVMGYVAGATAGEAIAQDQERYNSPRHVGGDRAAAGCPQPCYEPAPCYAPKPGYYYPPPYAHRTYRGRVVYYEPYPYAPPPPGYVVYGP